MKWQPGGRREVINDEVGALGGTGAPPGPAGPLTTRWAAQGLPTSTTVPSMNRRYVASCRPSQTVGSVMTNPGRADPPRDGFAAVVTLEAPPLRRFGSGSREPRLIDLRPAATLPGAASWPGRGSPRRPAAAPGPW